MNRPIAILFALMLASTASAQDSRMRDALLSPLPVRDQFLLSNGFYFFTPEASRSLPEGTWSLSITSSEANTFAKSAWISHSLQGRTTRSGALQTLADTRFDSVSTLFLVDGEIHRSDLTLARGFRNGLELRVTAPVTSTGGGWSDRTIEAVHHAMKIGNAERESLRRNTETVYLRHDGATFSRSRGEGFALGDIALSAKYELTPVQERGTNLAVVWTIELPTGRAQTLDGSGSVDGGLELIVSRDFERNRINASLGVIRLGRNQPLGLRPQVLITDTVAFAHRMGDLTAVIAQLTVSESPFRQLDVSEFSRRSYQMSVGVQRSIGGMIVHAAFIENVVNFENSADAGVAWGISRRF